MLFGNSILLHELWQLCTNDRNKASHSPPTLSKGIKISVIYHSDVTRSPVIVKLIMFIKNTNTSITILITSVTVRLRG
jgi:hypothetical protein